MIGYVQDFWDTYIVSNEGITTLLVILILLLKLYVNRRAEAIDYKKMLVSIPGEIIFLVLGFQMSCMIENETKNNSNSVYVSGIVFSLILLVIQYALEKWTEDKLSGNVESKVKVRILIMYILAIFTYFETIYGGV
ncbi:MAG: hypothetical protein K2I22_05370 [Lachnospiraceae bacterium]|nr:hypothetical protein [Lachnospiraceae bacterium]